MDKNDNKRTKKQVEKDGVIYTPSSYSEKELDRTQVVPSKEVRTQANTTRPTQRRRPSNNKSPKSGFALFFITTVFVGVLVCVLVFALVFKSTIGDKDNSLATKPPTSTTKPIIEDDKETVVLGVITAIDPETKKIDLSDLESDKKYQLYANGTTELKDKYGKAFVFAEYRIGDIVDAKFKSSESNLISLKVSPQYWEQKQIANVVVTALTNTVAVGNDKYTYDSSLISLYKDKPFDISTLDPIDVITVKGYKSKVLYVDVYKLHGYIVLEENKDIINGTVDIDTSDFIALDAAKEVKVLEGSHKIVVNGSNIEPFTEEMTVAQGEKYKLNLGEIIFKAGVVTFKINEPDSKLTVNGETKLATEPLILDYGKYDIKVEKQGFTTYEKTIDFVESTLELTVKLEKIVQVSQLTISTLPVGASIYIDNSYIGESPLTVSVEYGDHVLRVKKEGYVTLDNVPINVSTEAMAPAIELQPASGVLIP